MSSSIFDQTDWCEPCQDHHLHSHDEIVADQCGVIEMQGFATVLECARPSGHDSPHMTITGTTWNP